jgi:hypothetical protein
MSVRKQEPQKEISCHQAGEPYDRARCHDGCCWDEDGNREELYILNANRRLAQVGPDHCSVQRRLSN